MPISPRESFGKRSFSYTGACLTANPNGKEAGWRCDVFVVHVDAFLSEESNLLEWALGNAFSVVLGAKGQVKRRHFIHFG